jgi:hypothetical protein
MGALVEVVELVQPAKIALTMHKNIKTLPIIR